MVRAKTAERLPIVLSREEVARVLGLMSGTAWLICSLLYGSGMRLSECPQLRIKDVGFDWREVTVLGGRGQKNRVTVLPERLTSSMRDQLERVRALDDADREAGRDGVSPPCARQRNYPGAATDWAWQFVFPAKGLRLERESGRWLRHHVHPRHIQRAMQGAVRESGLSLRAAIRFGTASRPTGSSGVRTFAPCRSS